MSALMAQRLPKLGPKLPLTLIVSDFLVLQPDLPHRGEKCSSACSLHRFEVSPVTTTVQILTY